MDRDRIGLLAGALRRAAEEGIPIPGLRVLEEGLTMDDAYRIQRANVEEQISRGARITGKKIGLTSLAMQELLNVDQPDYGYLLSTMHGEGAISMKQILQPKVEGEVAFVLKRDLMGPGVTPTDALLATDYVTAALELVGSRIADWKIDICETIADNASSGMYVLGERRVGVDGLDMAGLGMSFYRNGALVNTGTGAAVLGHPAACVAWLANKMGEYGVPLKAGEVILSGALSAAVPAAAGDRFSAVFSKLGSVEIVFTE